MEGTIGGSAIVAKCLKKEGVKTLFTLAGGHTMSLYYACFDEGIEIIDCRSEADVVAAADAYAKATGGPGVLITTAGPGVSNTTTGMLEALTGRTPVVHIGGACQLALQGTGDMQDVDTLGVMRVCTKWARKVCFVERIADHLDDAFRHAMSGLPGPVYLEIPADVLMGVTDASSVHISEKSRTKVLPAPDAAAIERAAALLVAAERPLLVIGNAARYSCEPTATVAELATYLDMPIVAATIVRGLFLDEDDPLVKAGRAASQDADVVLTLCTANDLAFGKFSAPTYGEDARFIMVSTDSLAIGFNRDAEVGIVSGAAAAARAILEAVKLRTPPVSRAAHIARLCAQVDEATAAERDLVYGEAKGVRPGRCAAETVRFLESAGRDWTIVVDGGDGGAWLTRLAVVHKGAQLLGLIGNGSIGLAPGVAVGAWYAARKPILLYTGDGSFGYSVMEFSNFVKRGIPVVVVVSNDCCWGMVKGFEHEVRPQVLARYHQTCPDALAIDLPFVRYDQIAEVLGGHGEMVESAEAIVPAIRRAVAAGKPAIVNVRVEDIVIGGGSARTSNLAKGFAKYALDYRD